MKTIVTSKMTVGITQMKTIVVNILFRPISLIRLSDKSIFYVANEASFAIMSIMSQDVSLFLTLDLE